MIESLTGWFANINSLNLKSNCKMILMLLSLKNASG